MIELPNFSQRLKSEFGMYLERSEKYLKEAIDIAQQEAVVYEFDFSVTDALRDMAEICFLRAEYQSRELTYKYAKFEEQDF